MFLGLFLAKIKHKKKKESKLPLALSSSYAGSLWCVPDCLVSLFLHSELSSTVHEIGVLLLPGPRDSAMFFSPPSCSSAVVAHRGLCPAASGATPSRRREALECAHVDERLQVG